MSICGKSEFCRELARIAETDNVKANLMWNNYLNKHMIDMKKKKKQKDRNKDRKFAKDVDKKLKEQLEKEKQKQKEKLQVYQNAILNQNDEVARRKQQNKELTRAEQARLKREMAEDNAKFYKNKAERAAALKDKYLQDLERQKQNKNQANRDESELNRELDAKNRNYLIDDAWKEGHQKQLKNHFKDGLVNQMQDKDDAKYWEQQKKIADDEQYRDDLRRANDADLRRRKEIEDAKKQIFLNEIQNQEQERQAQKELDDNLSRAENDKVRQKLINDHMKYLDAEKRKRAMMNDHINKIGGQMQELDARKRKEAADAKKYHKTGLDTKGDYVAYELDNQANVDMIEHKKREAQKQAQQDKEFADEVQKKLQDALQKESAARREKLNVYKEAILNQND